MEAQKVGNQILAINSHWLIFVEGTECYGSDCYWWGGNLEGVADHPVDLRVPNHVVYSPHYCPPEVYNLSYFSAPDFPNNLAGIWEKHWGYIAKQGIAPIWLGEVRHPTGHHHRSAMAEESHRLSGQRRQRDELDLLVLEPDSGDTGGIRQMIGPPSTRISRINLIQLSFRCRVAMGEWLEQKP